MTKKHTSIRLFSTGATRDTADNKLDYDGFYDPRVIERFAEYMHEHRKQSDGTLRDSDNWKKGIPCIQYMKSLLRHTVTVWKLHHGLTVKPEKIGGVFKPVTLEDALCGVIFNSMGYLYEKIKQNENQQSKL